MAQRAGAGDPWGEPKNIGSVVNSSALDECPTLTPDGYFLFFVSARPGGCGGQDLWVSFRRNPYDDFGWEVPTNLGCQLNSEANDFTPSVFQGDDGIVYLYFSSNRTGAGVPGGANLYVSTLQRDGTFGPATLVPGLNTDVDDQRPNVRQSDGLEIFFESNRPGGTGGLDLWTSTRPSVTAAWATPSNLGATVNSSANEVRPALSWDATTLYLTSNRTGGFGGADLYVATRTRVRSHIEAVSHFVRLHYLDFLNREPDEGGWAFWSAQILQCAGDARCVDRKRLDVSRAFFYSGEFIAAHPELRDELRGTAEYNRAFVRQCYLTYLQRQCDPEVCDAAGFNFWVGKLNGRLPSTDADYTEMIRAFIVSAEYQARLAR